MRAKIIGAVILAAIIIAGVAIYIFHDNTSVTTIDGYLGGEKIGLFEDEEAIKIFADKYHIAFDYSRAGSLDMVTADQSGRNYLFPSSQTALEYYNDLYGKPKADEIIFNTPIVLYSHKIVVDALMTDNTITLKDGVYYADMEKLISKITEGVSWNDIGLDGFYGNICVDATDPTRSNSGNMFAALVACVLNGGKTVDEQSVENILPQLKEIFGNLGYMETSSSDLFNQFLRMGVGAKPIIAGYENQILEYAAENPENYTKLKDDIVIIYPTPTVWSTHIYMALDDTGKLGIDALCDSDIQELAWNKHGFRTGSYGTSSSGGEGNVNGIAEQINEVMNMPEYDAMKRIIEELQ